MDVMVFTSKPHTLCCRLNSPTMLYTRWVFCTTFIWTKPYIMWLWLNSPNSQYLTHDLEPQLLRVPICSILTTREFTTNHFWASCDYIHDEADLGYHRRESIMVKYVGLLRGRRWITSIYCTGLSIKFNCFTIGITHFVKLGSQSLYFGGAAVKTLVW
jgi:hypothetical protein